MAMAFRWQLPCELVELYRCLNGQERGAQGADLLVPGFRLLPLSEIVDEVIHEPVGRWEQVLLGEFASSEEGPGSGGGAVLGAESCWVELPLTDVDGPRRYTVRFPRRRAQQVSTAPPPLQLGIPSSVGQSHGGAHSLLQASRPLSEDPGSEAAAESAERPGEGGSGAAGAVEVSVWLRGAIGEGQMKANSVEHFLRRCQCN